MKYAKISLFLTLAAYLGVFVLSLMKLQQSSIYKSVGFVPFLIMTLLALVFYFISVIKEGQRDKTMWVLFGIIFPGISNIVYYYKTK